MTGLLLLALLTQAAVQAPPRDPRLKPTTGTGAVRGVTVDQPSGAPLHGITVVIVAFAGAFAPIGSMTSPPFYRETTSGPDGRFEFTGLPADDYLLSAAPPPMRAGHLRVTLGHKGSGYTAGAPSVSLQAGKEKLDVRLELPRSNAIEAQVVNEAGEPLARVPVTAARVDLGARGGPSRLTDDRGRVRLFGLDAGTYRVCAEPARAPDQTGMGSMSSADSERMRYTQSCAPGPVVLKGGETPSVVVQAGRAGSYTLSGSVTSATGADLSAASVMVYKVEADGAGGSVSSQYRDGQFVARGLLPGDYTVRAAVPVPGDRVYQSVSQSAVLRVKIEAADITGLSLRTVPAASVTGRVQRDPSARAPLPASIVVRAHPPLALMQLAGGPPPEAKVAADGSFTLNGLFGPTVLNASSATEGWFVKSIHHGGEDITDVTREFAAGDDRRVTVTLSDRTATLVVRPVDSEGKPRPDGVVLLLPADPAKWNTHWTTLSFPRAGGGEQRTRPGDYLVVAVSIVERSMQTGPAAMERLAKLGRRITLVEGERLEIDLPVTDMGGGQ